MYSHPKFSPRSTTRLTDVTTQQTAFTGSSLFSHVVLANLTAGAADVTFRGVADTPVIMRVVVPADSTVWLPGWTTTSDGLEVVSTAAVDVVFFHGVIDS